MAKDIKKIAILTSGGDSPGMNNTIRAIVLTAKLNNIEAYLVFEGYKGLIENNIKKASEFNLLSYINLGGTFIYSARYPEFKNVEVRKRAKDNLDAMGIDALVVIGGDGSYMGAQGLHELGVKTIALPGTIDNDISSSDFTIGYSTALNTIVKAVDSLRDTCNSHQRVMFLEVMGHGCGDLALYSGIATGAELIITNENILTVDEIIEVVKQQMHQQKKRSMIIIVSEFIYPNLKEIAQIVGEKTNIAARAMALEHVQRGGTPTAEERIRSTLLGNAAVELLTNGYSGVALGIVNNQIKSTPILEALAIQNKSNKEITIKYNKINQQ